MLKKIKLVDEKLSPGLRKIVHNIGWLSAERFLRMVLSFFVGIYVIRYLGPENFGKLSYSISFVALFIAISKLGLDQIVVRNLVKQKYPNNEILGTAFILKLIGSLIAIILVHIAIRQCRTLNVMCGISSFGFRLTIFYLLPKITFKLIVTFG